jgi:hypothetical protein
MDVQFAFAVFQLDGANFTNLVAPYPVGTLPVGAAVVGE